MGSVDAMSNVNWLKSRWNWFLKDFIVYRFYRRKKYISGMEMHPETTLTGNYLAIRV